MKQIKYLELEGKRVAYVKAGDSFRFVKPWKNEDGTYNWFNILTGGSWMNLLFTTLLVFLICMAIREYVNNIGMLLDCFRVPGQLQHCVQIYTPDYLRIIPR